MISALQKPKLHVPLLSLSTSFSDLYNLLSFTPFSLDSYSPSSTSATLQFLFFFSLPPISSFFLWFDFRSLFPVLSPSSFHLLSLFIPPLSAHTVTHALTQHHTFLCTTRTTPFTHSLPLTRTQRLDSPPLHSYFAEDEEEEVTVSKTYPEVLLRHHHEAMQRAPGRAAFDLARQPNKPSTKALKVTSPRPRSHRSLPASTEATPIPHVSTQPPVEARRVLGAALYC